MLILLHLLFISCLLQVCYSDIRYRKIKNSSTIILSLLSLLEGWLYWETVPLSPAVVVFAAGFLLNACGFIGAGDVKLMAALSLSLDADNTLLFIFLTTLAGLPVALVTLLTGRLLRKPAYQTVPYGVAIVGGFVSVVLLRVTV